VRTDCPSQRQKTHLCSNVLSTPKLVGEGGWGEHRYRFFGKPLRAISRFRHLDAQTPPSPLVKEGGGESHRGRFLARPCVPSPVSGICPPLNPCGRRGSGGGGQRRTGIKNAGRGRRPLPASPMAIMCGDAPSLLYRDSGLPDMIMDRKKTVATMSTMVKKAARNTPTVDLPG
jgi:hypothetical protein